LTEKHLHIVTHDVPWPADHGGVIDLFYKLKALHAQGVNIHLHCFTKGRTPQTELDKYCSSVNYYQRKNNISRFSFKLPYIVNSRANDELITALQKDEHPVLLEGIHCTYHLFKEQLQNRKVARHESGFLKKIYYLLESRLLKKYEKTIANKVTFLAVSKQDVDLYRQELAAKDIHYLPVFLSYTLAIGKEGKSCFCLYHGNLAINENEKAAIWLLQHVFSKLSIPFVIAGKDPSEKLQRLAHNHPQTCLVANPSDKEMQDMICKAHVHVLPSMNNTGIKLKLLNAVFNGRHCLVNKAAVEGSGLESCCHIADDAASFQQQIEALYLQPFTEQEIQQRQGLLQTTYNSEVNARELMTFLW